MSSLSTTVACARRSGWPLERVLFAMAGAVTLGLRRMLGQALAAGGLVAHVLPRSRRRSLAAVRWSDG